MGAALNLSKSTLQNLFGQKCFVSGHGISHRFIQTASRPLLIKCTQVLWAEPMKKKKKLDPGLAIQKEIKKQKKIEKQIKKLESKGRILKPIEEIEGNREVLKTIGKRQRQPATITEEESERRALLHKEWSRYKMQQFVEEERLINRAIACQRKALDELRNESEELYQLAIQLDEKLIPFKRRGPMDTPAIKNYIPPDGDYIDTTRKFDK